MLVLCYLTARLCRVLVKAIVGGNVPTEVRQRREGVTSSADNLCVKHLSKSNSAVSCNDFSDEASSVDMFVDGFNFLLICDRQLANREGFWALARSTCTNQYRDAKRLSRSN